MATPTIDAGARGQEPPAPIVDAIVSPSFPDVALGIVREPQPASTDADGTGTDTDAAATAEAAAAEAAKTPAAAAAAATGGSNGDLDWESIRKTEQYQKEVSTALNRQFERHKAELEAAEANKKRLEELENEQKQYDMLLERADNDSDPVEQAKAQVELANMAKVTRLTTKIEERLKPILSAAVSRSVVDGLTAQYDTGLAEAEKILGKDVAGELSWRNFDNGGKWVETLVARAYEEGGKKALADFRRGGMKAEIDAAVAQRMAAARMGLPRTDTSEGIAGGQNPNGVYDSEDAVHDAIANGEISAARGRRLLANMGRRFPVSR